MLSWQDALAHILAHTHTLNTEELPIHEAAGRLLREPIHAPFPMPRFSASAMDGYALHHADIAQASEASAISLPVLQHIAASQAPTPLKRGECARIFTGAPVPEGADVVVIQENVTAQNGHALFRAPATPFQNIRPLGSDCSQGTLLLPEGSPLYAGEIGLLAGLGVGMVHVTRRPRVAVLACGSELRRIGEPLGPADIYESNRHALAVQIREAGGDPYLLPVVPDQLDALQTQIREGLHADVLISSGGASVGDHDLLRPAFDALGVATDFWRVAMRPGKPLFFGKHQQCLIFGLPGNPASSMVTFEVLVRPALQKMLGSPALYRPLLCAQITEPASNNTKRTHFVRGQLSFASPQPLFTPLSSQSSADLLSMRQAHALAILPPSSAPVKAGDSVQVLWITHANSLQLLA